MTVLIGFAGQAGVGKDWVGGIVRSLFQDALILAFADALKMGAIQEGLLTFNEAFGSKTGHTRKILQDYGTQTRIEKGDTIWCDLLEAWVRLHTQRGVRMVIITDVRFKIELDLIHRLGGRVYLITAPDRNFQRREHEGFPKTHISETELLTLTYDGEFDNSFENQEGIRNTLCTYFT